MSLLDYKSFLNESSGINEAKVTGNYINLENYLGGTGMKPGTTVDYKDIFDKAAGAGGPDAAILNEIQGFEDFLTQIGSSASGDVATQSENLVAIILTGSEQANSNTDGEAATIFSDVTLASGEKVSVKTSNKPGFTGVLGNSRIKVQQLISVIMSSGISSVTDKEKDDFMTKLESDPQSLKDFVSKDTGLYSIAAAYKSGVDYVVEKSAALTRLQILEGLLTDVALVKGYVSKKGEISTVDGFLMKGIGFSVAATYKIKGVSLTELGTLANERGIILNNIKKKVSTPDLRTIAKANQLPTDKEL